MYAYEQLGLPYLEGPHTSVAQVFYGPESAAGDAKRNKHERRNPDVAADLAIGRALIALGEKLVKRGNAALNDQ